MRQPVQRASSHSGVPPTRRLAILDSRARVSSTTSGRLAGLRGVAVASLGLLIWLACSAAPPPSATPAEEETSPFIVQGTDLATVLEAVREVGGEVTHELAVIRAVGARLTPSQRAELEALDGITRVWEDRPVSIQSLYPVPETNRRLTT